MPEPRVGVALPQFTSDPQALVGGAARAEAAGFDSLWLFDHLWPLGDRNRPFMEGWASLAHLSVLTSVTIGTLVTRSSLRAPAVLARMAATVASAAPGRVVVGLGSGDELTRAENEAFGLPFYEGAERAAQLERAAAAVRTVPRVRLWLGGWAPAVQRAAARLADGWNGWGGDPARLRRAARRIATEAGGRRVEITWGTQVMLGRDDAEARAALAGRDPGGFVWGGPGTVAARMAEFVAAGATHLVAAFPGAARPGVYERFAAEVVPRLRELVPQGGI